MAIILASASPRRQALLGLIFQDFRILPSSVEEFVPHDIELKDIPVYLSGLKAEDIAVSHRDDLVIGCDTAVIKDSVVFGKPKDAREAEYMLSELSGKIHSVVTGCCIMQGRWKYSFSEETRVEFYSLTQREIDDYIATGEPFDKAGAYGIQEQGAFFVKGIYGDYFNVVGLPVARLKRELEKFKIEF